MNNILDFIGNHRSIRKFTEKQIDIELLKLLITKAQYASTSSFLQPYSVIRVNNKENRKKLSLLSGDQKYIESCSEFLVFCADLKRLTSVSAMHDTDVKTGYTEPFILSTVDASLFAQNVMLGAESLGLGGVFIGGIRNNPEEVCKLLEIPSEVYPVFGMCLGYPNQDPDTKPRLPVDIILKEEKYTEDDLDLLNSYDTVVKEYYIKRTRGKIDHTWTEQVSDRMDGELRPHMKSFLAKQNMNIK